eukprot:354903-Chlamydomonas_euryale.AAC.5
MPGDPLALTPPSQDESMANAKLVLDRTMKRLNVAWNHARSNHMLVLVLSAILLFFAIYVFAKIYRVGRMPPAQQAYETGRISRQHQRHLHRNTYTNGFNQMLSEPLHTAN